MDRKPDIIRSIVLIFAVGLVITGFTSLKASEDEPTAVYSPAGIETVMVPAARD